MSARKAGGRSPQKTARPAGTLLASALLVVAFGAGAALTLRLVFGWGVPPAPPAAAHGVNPPDAGGDAPALRGARVRQATPLALHLHVRTHRGGLPPAGTTVIVSTPPALQSEREPEAGYASEAPLFEGHRLAIEGLRYRLWNLWVGAPGHESVARELVLPEPDGGGAYAVHVELKAWALLSVLVTDAGGAAVEGSALGLDFEAAAPRGAGVSFPADRAERKAWSTARTDRHGHLVLRCVPPGRKLRLRATHPDHPPALVGLTTPAPGAMGDVAVQFGAPSGLRGRVDLAAFGVDADAVRLTLFLHRGMEAVFQRRTGVEPDGSFFLRNIRPGLQTVQVAARGAVGRDGVLPISSASVVAYVAPESTHDVGLLQPVDGENLRVRVRADEPYPRGATVRAHVSVFEPLAAGTHEVRIVPTEFDLSLGVEYVLRGLPACTLGASFTLIDRTGAFAPAHATANAAVEPEARALLLEVVVPRTAPAAPEVRLDLRFAPPEGVRPKDLSCRLLIFDADDVLVGGFAEALPPGTHALQTAWARDERRFTMRALAHGLMSGVRVAESLASNQAVRFADWTPAATVSVRVTDPTGRVLPPEAIAPLTVEGRLVEDGPAAVAARLGHPQASRLTVLPGRTLRLELREQGLRCSEVVVVEGRSLVAGGTHEVVLVRRASK